VPHLWEDSVVDGPQQRQAPTSLRLETCAHPLSPDTSATPAAQIVPHAGSSNSALASCKSAVLNPSVNQPCPIGGAPMPLEQIAYLFRYLLKLH